MSSFFFQAEDGIRDLTVTGVQTCALPIYAFGEAASEPTQEQTIEAREVQRKTAYEGDCETPNKTEEEQLACRDAIRPLETGRSEERRVGKECRCGWSR